MLSYLGPKTLPLALITLFQVAHLCTAAAKIKGDCFPNNAEIALAFQEAQSIADYASKRWSAVKAPRKGTLMMDMLGAPNEDDESTFTYAKQWFEAARDIGNGADTLTVHCSDDFMRYGGPSMGGQRWFDPDFPGAPAVIMAQGTAQHACGGRLRAFEYNPIPGQHVIVLCADSTNGALAPGVPIKPTFGDTLDKRNSGAWKSITTSGGLTINSPAYESLGLDIFADYLSYKILHELMHATGPQFPAAIPTSPQVAGQPINTLPELYGYARIAGRSVGTEANGGGPSAYARQRNADSFALLGCGWYLPPYVWKNGQIRAYLTGAPSATL